MDTKAHLAACRGPRCGSDLGFLVTAGIRALVRLAYDEETGISGSDVREYGIEDCYEPVKDFTAPAQKQIDRLIKFIASASTQRQPVAISCGAGYGRTGTILACYLVYGGQVPDNAIQEVIQRRPGSNEILRVPGQKDAVLEFHRRLRNGDVSL
jgi:atypical dual specificity phosphatase